VNDMNPRQAEFVRLYLTGTSAAEAARRAGYSEGYARKSAYHLLSKPAIKAALDKAREKTMARTEYGLESAVAELDEMIAAAREAKQFTAVGSLLGHKLKLFGLLVDRVATVSVDISSALAEARNRALSSRAAITAPADAGLDLAAARIGVGMPCRVGPGDPFRD